MHFCLQAFIHINLCLAQTLISASLAIQSRENKFKGYFLEEKKTLNTINDLLLLKKYLKHLFPFIL